MIKRLSLAATLLVVCFSLCFLSYFSLNKMTNELVFQLEIFCENADSNKDEAQNAVSKCNTLWNKYHKYYSIFLDHSLFETLNINLPAIKPLYSAGNEDEALQKGLESIYTLKTIMEEQEVNIGNIF